ncbi:MAG TPA: ABC transporter ATP-binding protein [Gammaproteobacteria bacterium]|nr:ABC transporter ATP-binding protein [Gammaproteobacteria bacterium]
MTVRGVHLKLENLTHRYTPKSPLTFESVNLEAGPGEALVFVGRSGCGKSTLLNIMAGLRSPSSGRALINGEGIRGTSPRWVMMFQAPSLFPWMTVAQNAGIGLFFNGWSKKDREERVRETLKLVQLQGQADSNVQDLSGGQQQRVALARSLVMEPEMLLLDEPFSALDAFTRSTLQRDVRAIAKERNINLVMVTHDIDEAVLMADRALIIAGSPGKICHDYQVNLEDPRDREDPKVQSTRSHLMELFTQATQEEESQEDGPAEPNPSQEVVEDHLAPHPARQQG